MDRTEYEGLEEEFEWPEIWICTYSYVDIDGYVRFRYRDALSADL